MMQKKWHMMLFFIILIITLLTACSNKKTTADAEEGTEITTANDFVENVSEDINLKIDKDMPVIRGEGAKLVDFYQPCKGKLDNLPVELMNLADRESVVAWIADSEEQDIIPEKLDDYVNIYSYIHTFHISEENVRTALQGLMQADYLPEGLAITEEDLTVLFSGDKTAISEHFASDYSIVIEENIYSPQWMYYHTEEDYQSAGITPEMILQKVEFYSAIPLSANARNAFADKLSKYIGEKVVFSTDILDEFYGGLYYDFEGYYLDTGTEKFDVEWLGTHTIQDYAKNGITTDMLEEFLEQISEFDESDEYDWINSCLMRMSE